MKKITKAILKKREERLIKKQNKLKWKDLQQQLLKRDDYRCVFCGKLVNLKHFQSCHIIPEEFIETRYDLNNLLLACFYHHKVGKYSMHNHPLWFTLWLQKNRPEKYEYLIKYINSDLLIIK